MKIVKKLLTFLLAAQMSLIALPATVYAEDDIIVPSADSPFVSGSVDTDSLTPPADNSEEETGEYSDSAPISFMSLLPFDDTYTDDVWIDRSGDIPAGLTEKSFYVREALSDVIPEDEMANFSGKILYSPNDSSYRAVGFDDVISLDDFYMYSTWDSDYGYVYYKTVYFIVGNNADDQLDNTGDTKCKLTVHFKNLEYPFIKSTSVEILNASGTKINIGRDYVSGSSSTSGKYYYVYDEIVSDSLAENEIPKLKVTLPTGYSESNVSIYQGLIYNSYELTSATDITASVLSGSYSMNDNTYYCDAAVTFVVSRNNGDKTIVPFKYTVYTAGSYVSLYTEDTTPSTISKKSVCIYGDVDATNSMGYCDIYETDSFDNLKYSAYANYSYFDKENLGYIYDLSIVKPKIQFACWGNYTSKEEAVNAGAEDIKDTLISNSYDTAVDFSKLPEITGYLKDGTSVKIKHIYVTVVDEEGVLYGYGSDIGIVSAFPTEPDPVDPIPSSSTSLSMYGANVKDDEGNNRSLSYYTVSSSDDSYYSNGFQTVFILDKGNSVADSTIYPKFYSGTNAKIFTADGVQTSGESPMTFVSGKAVQYSASAENGVDLKNYWVTYVTQQEGAKLFVNATNSPDHISESGRPKREIFLNYSHGFSHDIFFANIGKEPLTGINVSLSADTKGVKLDPYWTVIDTSVKRLNGFTKTSNPDNIAKVRLVPIDDDYFGEISGTLTISTENGGSVSIDLTGIAGVPKIVTDTLRDGVRYVPYSHVIMTNSMYGTSSMAFRITSGNLPNGIELKPNGELYGIPTEAGEFTFTVEAKYTGSAELSGYDCIATHPYTLVIKDNSDANVDAVNSDDQGYPLQKRVSRYVTVYYTGTIANPNKGDTGEGLDSGLPIVQRIELDSDLFWSDGSYSTEFMDFYIDGIKLTEGTDYTAEEGSTKITVQAQTFGHTSITGSDTPHTLAGEFRTDNRSDELKRSAQNVYINYVKVTEPTPTPDPTPTPTPGGDSGSSGSSSTGGTINPEVTVKTKEEKGSVTASFNVVDGVGNPIPNLVLELHSEPKYAKTDSNGVTKIEGIEFGKHTLYIQNLETGKKVSRSFTLESGDKFSVKNNVITAKSGTQITLSVMFDGKNIKLSDETPENVEAGAGMFDFGNVIEICTDNYVLILLSVVTVSAFFLFIGKKIRGKSKKASK